MKTSWKFCENFVKISWKFREHFLFWKKFAPQKCRGERVFGKKRPILLQFSVLPQKVASSSCQSYNFDPRKSAHGPSESLCPMWKASWFVASPKMDSLMAYDTRTACNKQSRYIVYYSQYIADISSDHETNILPIYRLNIIFETLGARVALPSFGPWLVRICRCVAEDKIWWHIVRRKKGKNRPKCVKSSQKRLKINQKFVDK